MTEPSVKLVVGGDVQAKNGTYLERPADDELFEACLAHEFTYVLACRQIGKSSLKNAIAQRLIAKGICVARLDLNEIGKNIKDPNEWYFGLLYQLDRYFSFFTDVMAWWDRQPPLLTPTQRFLHFLREVLLIEIAEPVVIFIDEIDVTLGLPFTDDFFAAIRVIHNDRAQYPAYKRLTFVLLGVATPDELIHDQNRTPFNIGLPIPMRDFTRDECVRLHLAIKAKHSAEQSETYFQQIYDWTNGHPYLTQKLCAAVAKAEPRPDLVKNQVHTIFLSDKEDKKDSNLRFVQSRVLNDPHRRQMLHTYQKIWRNKTVLDDEQSIPLNRLKLYGLVVADKGTLKVRNKIYQEVFDLAWAKANTPVDWTRRATIGLLILLMVVTSTFGFNLWQQAQITDEEQAFAYGRNFENATDPNERLENLARLFELEGYDGQACNLFSSLPTNEQTALFAEVRYELKPQTITVIREISSCPESPEYGEDLLKEMRAGLVRLSEEESAKEIEYWLEGRNYAGQADTDYELALDSYDKAISKNGNNIAARFERALVLAKIKGEKERALSDFEQILKSRSNWHQPVQQGIESDEDLYRAFINNPEEYSFPATLERDCVALDQDGQTFFTQNENPKALQKFNVALICYEKRAANDIRKQTSILHHIGRVHEAEKRYNDAQEAYQKALTILQKEGYQAEEATTLLNLGGVYEIQRQYDDALNAYQEALAIWREMEGQDQEGITLYNIGRVYDVQERYDDALLAYQRAADVYQTQGDYAQLLEPSQRMLTIQRKLGNRAEEGAILYNIGSIYSTLARYQEALDSYQQALTIQREVRDRAREGNALNGIGVVYSNQGKYDQALELHEQALFIFREVGDRAGEGTSLNNIGEVYHNQGKYDQALAYLEQALEISREVGDRAGEGKTLDNIGLVYHNQGKYEQALELYQQALKIRREVGDRAGEGTTANNIGLVYHNQGKYDQALAFFQQALEIAREVGDRAGEGATANNIGRVYDNQGKYDQALEQYQKALFIFGDANAGDRAGEGRTLDNIGLVYHNQGKYDQALGSYQQALEIRREVGDRAGEGTSLNNIGQVYYAHGQYELALEQFSWALEIRREVSDRAGEGRSLNNIGEVYHSQGRYELALEQFQRALLISREVGDRAGEGTSLNNIGEVYHNQGQYELALEQYQQALEIRREVGDRVGEGRTLDNIGFVYEQQGQAEEALVYYEQAQDVFEAVRATAGDDQERASFMAQYADLYDRAIDLYHQQGQEEYAFYTSERGRARSFLDSLATGRVQLSNDGLQELLAREREVYDQRFAIRDALARARAQNPPDVELVADLEAQLEAVEEAYSKVQAHIEVRGDELAALVPGRSSVPTLAEVQAQLDEETTLISYWVLGDEGTLAFVMTRESLVVVELPLATRENLFTMLQDLYLWFSVDNAHPSSLQALHTWLVEPLAGHLKTAKVGIIPHQLLHYVPFAALTGGESYFGEHSVLFTLPSASALRFIQDNAKSAAEMDSQGALVFGNPTTDEVGFSPLPYAAKEAETVAALLGTSHYTRSDATETQFRESVVGQKVVHLAAHGVHNRIVPLENTFIALGPDGEHDGRLKIREIYGLKLTGNQLVTLSASQTQIGGLFEEASVVSAGDEIVGLTRAFFFAGTPTVVSSLWNVDDAATEELMSAFYRNWLGGMGKAEALQAAQAEVRANPRWASPYYWAGFVVNGDPGEVSSTPQEPSAPNNTFSFRVTLGIAAGLLGMMLLTLVYVRRRREG